MISNVYFHIDEIGRDGITASALKQAFAERGVNLVYGNRIYTTKVLERFIFAFDAIILPRPLFMKIFKKLNREIPPVIIVYTESVGRVIGKENEKFVLFSLLDKDFMDGDKSYVDKITSFCLWGPRGKKIIQRHYPDILNKLFIVGHPRHDKRALKKRVKKNFNDKPKIGLITRQPLLNDHLKRKPVDAIVKRYARLDELYEFDNKKTGDFLLSQDNEPVDEIYLEAVDIKILLTILLRLNKKGFEVHLKVHPREEKNLWEEFVKRYNLNVVLAHWRTPFSNWIKKLDYVIGPSSTSFYDCCVSGVIPICTRKIDKNRDFHLNKSSEENGELMKHILTPSSIDEILNIVSNKYEKFELSDEIKKVLFEETNYPNSLDSINKIVDVTFSSKKKKLVNPFLQKIYMLGFYLYANLIVNLRLKITRFFSKKTDQGSTFIMTKKNIDYINNLID